METKSSYQIYYVDIFLDIHLESFYIPFSILNNFFSLCSSEKVGRVVSGVEGDLGALGLYICLRMFMATYQ